MKKKQRGEIASVATAQGDAMTDSPVEPPSAPESARPGEPPTISSEELFRGGRIVAITHAGETYRLLITRNNRLILQK